MYPCTYGIRNQTRFFLWKKLKKHIWHSISSDSGKWFRIRIRIHFRIQDFDDQKLKKKNKAEIFYLFLNKLQEKPSALKREHPALQKMKCINFFLFLWVIFALLDTDPEAHGIRIQSVSVTLLLVSKCSIFYFLGLYEEPPSSRRSLQPSLFQNMKFLNFYPDFGGHFFCLSGIRVRVLWLCGSGEAF